MKTAFAAVLAAAIACCGLPAVAADGLTKHDAKDLKTESKAQYEARKDVADANHELNKADCEVMADGSTERACKKEARAIRKQEKAEAKTVHEAEKDVIKAHTGK